MVAQAHSAVTNFLITSGTSNEFDISFGNDAWGVMAGPNEDPDNPSAIDPTSTYNSCTLPTAPQGSATFPILPCHENRVDGPTLITITFNETDDFPGTRNATAIFTQVNTDVTNPQAIELAESQTLYTAGQPVTLNFTWADVCQIGFNGNLNQNGQCQNAAGELISGTIPVNIGLDNQSNGQISSQLVNFRLYNPDPSLGVIPLGDDGTPCGFANAADSRTGVCEILPLAGDEGAFLVASAEGFDATTRFAGPAIRIEDSFDGQIDSLSYTGIRLYFFESADPLTYFPFSNDALVVDLSINNPSPLSLIDDEVSGLTNGTTYTVLAASIDESGTVSQFFLPTNTAEGAGYCSSGLCPTVIPSQIAGVIAESDCFITTATYGSPFAYQVRSFQAFRERFLRNTFLGEKIIDLYNKFGPVAAVKIRSNKSLKLFSSITLYPFYLFSKLSLKVGLFLSFILSLGLLLLLFLVYKSILRKKKFYGLKSFDKALIK